MDSPLNKAHFFARKSLNYNEKEKKMKYLEQTIENFKLALEKTNNLKAIESIQLQIGYYEKQLKLLSLRDALCQKSEKQKNDDDLSYLKNFTINEHVEQTTLIQLDLLKNLEDSYKIIEELNSVDNVDIKSQVSQLQNLNSQLNLMFHKLSVSVEEVLRENEILRDKVKLVDDSKSATTCNLSEKEENNSEHRDSDDSSQEIQDLPPLELPSFNLDVLDK